MEHKLFHIIHVEYLATECVAANRKQPNARNYERNESRRESGGKTDRQAGRKRRSGLEAETMKARNDLDGH